MKQLKKRTDKKCKGSDAALTIKKQLFKAGI